jgi:hypothetical protein
MAVLPRPAARPAAAPRLRLAVLYNFGIAPREYVCTSDKVKGDRVEASFNEQVQWSSVVNWLGMLSNRCMSAMVMQYCSATGRESGRSTRG